MGRAEDRTCPLFLRPCPDVFDSSLAAEHVDHFLLPRGTSNVLVLTSTRVRLPEQHEWGGHHFHSALLVSFLG